MSSLQPLCHIKDHPKLQAAIDHMKAEQDRLLERAKFLTDRMKEVQDEADIIKKKEWDAVHSVIEELELLDKKKFPKSETNLHINWDLGILSYSKMASDNGSSLPSGLTEALMRALGINKD